MGDTIMKEHSIQDLGTLVHLFMKGNHPDTAQIYLNEMQARVTAAKKQPLLHSPAVPAPAMNDDVRLDLSDVPVPEPISQPAVHDHVMLPEEPKRGPLRDDQGNVTRVSVLSSERGFDPGAYENKELKIFCDGVHIPTAHTADTVEGLVRYYEKDGRGRIKTEEVRGKVEIRGL
jgi:hypothetical protein